MTPGTPKTPARPSDRGRLVVIAGCMFAGKTTRLIAHLAAAQSAGRRVLAIKHQLDDRYDAVQLSTHDGRHFAGQAVPDADAIVPLAKRADVLGIDEMHFFWQPLVAVCRRLRESGKEVITAGIDHDAWGQAFPAVAALKDAADDVELLTTPCSVCGASARYSQRLQPVTDLTMVGGPGDYAPRCERCFEPLQTVPPVYEKP
jgi:thymidine kinase